MKDTKETKTRTQNKTKVKRSELQSLPLKQRKFIKAYIESGNGTRSAIKAGYSERSASTQASRLLKNERVLSILNDSVEEAEGVIRGLMSSESEAIALQAAREVLDRTVGKPVQRSESTHINITVESMLDDAS